MTSVIDAIRSLFIPMHSVHIVVPNSAVAEVIGHLDSEFPVDNAPEWMLGKIRWREQLIPVISFDVMLGVDRTMASSTSRLIITKALDPALPFIYYAVEARMTPKVLSVYPFVFEAYEAADDEPELPEILQCKCMVNGDVAAIPALDKIESLVGEYWQNTEAVDVD